MSFVRDLDTPLLKLSPQDSFTLRDAVAGVHVFGAIGSGKTSGSGKALAGAYLRAGMGGLVLCAKPEEVELWQRYAAANGRSNSVLLFDESQGFNFLTYELARQGMAGIGSVTECLMRVLEAARRPRKHPLRSAPWPGEPRSGRRTGVFGSNKEHAEEGQGAPTSQVNPPVAFQFRRRLIALASP